MEDGFHADGVGGEQAVATMRLKADMIGLQIRQLWLVRERVGAELVAAQAQRDRFLGVGA
eukprot:9516795-Alexandrium_andersonii.AAC.1